MRMKKFVVLGVFILLTVLLVILLRPQPTQDQQYNFNYVTDNIVTKDKNTVPTQPALTVPDLSTKQTNTFVEITTNKGAFQVELFNSTMPVTAGNFLKLVTQGFYNNVIFHRIIDGFMIQGGDPTGTGMGGPGYKIKDEFSAENRNARGTLSMANAGPNTGGSQFFINLVDNNFLDTKHPVFGKVVSGMEVIDAIAKVKTDFADKPLEEVKMLSFKVQE